MMTQEGFVPLKVFPQQWPRDKIEVIWVVDYEHFMRECGRRDLAPHHQIHIQCYADLWQLPLDSLPNSRIFVHVIIPPNELFQQGFCPYGLT